MTGRPIACCTVGALLLVPPGGHPAAASGARLVWSPAGAQPDTSTDTTLRPSLPVALSTAITDTGAFARGHRDFSHYATPGMCAAAAVTTGEVLRHSLAALRSEDTLRSRPDEDTLPAQVAVVARTCGAQFTLANTPAPEWKSLFDLALLARNDSLAQAVLAREVAAFPKDRAALQREALDVYLGNVQDQGLHPAEPARPQLAEALVARIDQVGDGSERLAAHLALLQYGVTVQDERLSFRETSRIAALVQQLAQQPRVTNNQLATYGQFLNSAFSGLMGVAYFTAADSVRAIAAQVQRALHGVASDAVCQAWMPTCRTASPEQIEAFLVSNLPGLCPASAPATSTDSHCQTVPPLHATFWFPGKAAGKTAGAHDTLFPVPGRITLMVRPENLCQVSDANDGTLSFPVCYGVPTSVRHWLQEYGSRGVSIVLVTSEYGAAFLSGVETPAQEAERIRWYYQDYWGLPVTVAVQVPRTHTLPAPDGRRFGAWTDTTLFLQGNSGLLIVGRDGKRMQQINFLEGIASYPAVDQALQWALRISPPGDSATAARSVGATGVVTK